MDGLLLWVCRSTSLTDGHWLSVYRSIPPQWGMRRRLKLIWLLAWGRRGTLKRRKPERHKNDVAPNQLAEPEKII